MIRLSNMLNWSFQFLLFKSIMFHRTQRTHLSCITFGTTAFPKCSFFLFSFLQIQLQWLPCIVNPLYCVKFCDYVVFLIVSHFKDLKISTPFGTCKTRPLSGRQIAFKKISRINSKTRNLILLVNKSMKWYRSLAYLIHWYV